MAYSENIEKALKLAGNRVVDPKLQGTLKRIIIALGADDEGAENTHPDDINVPVYVPPIPPYIISFENYGASDVNVEITLTGDDGQTIKYKALDGNTQAELNEINVGKILVVSVSNAGTYFNLFEGGVFQRNLFQNDSIDTAQYPTGFTIEPINDVPE